MTSLQVDDVPGPEARQQSLPTLRVRHSTVLALVEIFWEGPSRHVPKAVTDPLLPCLTRPWEVNLLTTVARQR
jgi:hypothetical protein